MASNPVTPMVQLLSTKSAWMDMRTGESMKLFEESVPEVSSGDLLTVQGLVRLQQLPGIGPNIRWETVPQY